MGFNIDSNNKIITINESTENPIFGDEYSDYVFNFYGQATNANAVTAAQFNFYETSKNTATGELYGNALFRGAAENEGVVIADHYIDQRVYFTDHAENKNTCTNVHFRAFSTNRETASALGRVSFGDNAINLGYAMSHENNIFRNSSLNYGTITSSTSSITADGTFRDNAGNFGVVVGHASFHDSAYNSNEVTGRANFYDSTNNHDLVSRSARFFDNAQNNGAVSRNGYFHSVGAVNNGAVDMNLYYVADNIETRTPSPTAGGLLGVTYKKIFDTFDNTTHVNIYTQEGSEYIFSGRYNSKIYINGTSTNLSEAALSTWYYKNRVKSLTYTTNFPLSALDQSSTFYTYTSGQPSTASCGTFWYSFSSTSWSTPSNWLNSQICNDAIPDANTNVVCISGVAPYVDLDNLNGAVQPNSINARSVGITFYSQTSANITCPLSGTNIVFAGNARFGV